MPKLPPFSIEKKACGAASLKTEEPRSIAELFGPASTQQMLMRMEVSLARVQARRGIIPAEDIHILKQLGVAAVYTPKDFRLSEIVEDLAALGLAHRAGTNPSGSAA